MTLAGLFLRPELWPLLLVGPAAWLALLFQGRRRRRRLARALGTRHAALTSERSPTRQAVHRALFSAALVLLGVAAMGPVAGTKRAGVAWQGADVITLLDVSRSMLARDVPPSRLMRAKQEIRALAEIAEGDRFGLVVFAGEAKLVVPLTRDRRSFVAMTDGATPESVSLGGTDLGAAIDRAREALARREGAGVIVLLTDGEDLSEHGIRAAERCRDEGISIHTIGLGTPRGSKIALDSASPYPFLRDREGREVISTLDEATLGEVAATTGGSYLRAAASARALASLYEDEIVPAARATLAEAEDGQPEDRFQAPLLVAILLLLLELGLGASRAARASPRREGSAAVALLLLLSLLLLGGCDRTKEGRELWEAGQPEEAYEAFGRAVDEAGESASPQLHFDHALAALHVGELDVAAKAARRVAQGGDDALKAKAAFVRGGVAFLSSKARALEAKKRPRDLRALLPAIRDAEDALAAWQWAAASRPDWPAARRNAARARLWLESLRETRSGEKQKPKPLPQPQPGDETEPEDPSERKPPLPPPPAPEPAKDPETPEAKKIRDLPPGKLLGLFEVLREKEREKQAVRRARRATEASEVSKDW